MFRWFAAVLLTTTALAADPTPSPDTAIGDSLLRQYFQAETARLTEECLDDVTTLADWTSRRDEYRRQLFDMLGLDPLPERTPLNPVITGALDHPEFTVEKLHFQSRPGLYVTGNLYLPKHRPGLLPAILYVCGHGRVVKDGVSLGNKTSYQHHGEWFARNGYVCLTIDTIQLGEIEGLHHGTYREGMWWWHSRGYTPAGVEAWNGIRALDYLQSRPEVDGTKLGVTGRSGGGAYSWWIAALDERIKVAVPVAGITSLQNHVVDGCIEGHCDCMFQVNTFHWDYPFVAALVAPRPLLISNTDKDTIFPLDGVYDVHTKTRKIYELHGAEEQLGFHITEGPHKDTQELRAHAFVWFERFLKGEVAELDTAAPKLFEPEQLKVFEALPEDEKVTTVQEWFVPVAESPAVPQTADEWALLKAQWWAGLRSHVLDECPEHPAPCEPVAEFRRDGVRLTMHQLYVDGVFPLDLFVAHAESLDQPTGVTLEIVDQPRAEDVANLLIAGVPEMATEMGRRGTGDAASRTTWDSLCADLRESQRVQAWFVPRGVGATEWTRNEKERTHILRRFALLGRTADELRTYDSVQALRAIRGLPGARVDLAETPLTLTGIGSAAGWALYASLLEPNVQRLDLMNLASTHDVAPILLNVRRYLDIPEALALAAEQKPLRLELLPDDVHAAEFAAETAEQLGWGDGRVEVFTETERVQ